MRSSVSNLCGRQPPPPPRPAPTPTQGTSHDAFLILRLLSKLELGIRQKRSALLTPCVTRSPPPPPRPLFTPRRRQYVEITPASLLLCFLRKQKSELLERAVEEGMRPGRFGPEEGAE